MIILVSDGVHDNLDPQQLGKLPSDLDIQIKDNSWKELEKTRDKSLYSEAERRKNIFTSKFINALIGGEKSLQSGSRNTPTSIVETLIAHANEVTKASREFMEQNPGTKLPKEYSQFPGKMDHATCVVFEAGFKKRSTPTPPQHKKTHSRVGVWEEYKTEDGETYFYNPK